MAILRNAIAVIPEVELRTLQLHLLKRDTPAALEYLRSLQSMGAIGPSTPADGAPVHARDAYAELPRYMPMATSAYVMPPPPNSHDLPIVTTDDVRSAFELLAELGRSHLLSVKVLHAATTSPLLQRRPLSPGEWGDMCSVLGITDPSTNIVALARFNSALAVLPPFATDPKPPSRCALCCCCCRWAYRAVRGTSRQKQDGTYAEASDLEGMSDEDGALVSRAIAI